MTLISIVNTAFEVYLYMVIARVLISWVPHNPSQPIIRFLYEATEPLLAPCRRLTPSLGGIDLSPIIAVMLIELLRRVVLEILFYVL